MINATNLYVKYGDRVLLNNVNVIIETNDKVGLVGRNGAGKSTILKIIANYISPDSGQVNRPGDTTLGFLHQEMDCLLYTSPSPRDQRGSRMPSSA